MTAGIYVIKNTQNNRVYVGSSINIEKRFQTHFDDLRGQKHHSWKLQEDWDKFHKNTFVTEVIHSFDKNDQYLELLLEIFERSEVLSRSAVGLGYNVSDEIIRDTSLVIKFCDDAIGIYYEANEKRFAEAKRKTIDQDGLLKKLARLMFSTSKGQKHTDALDVELRANDYLQEKLEGLFIQSGLNESTSIKLAQSYVIDVGKLRRNDFRYWRRKK